MTFRTDRDAAQNANETPPNLHDFMLKGWNPGARKPPASLPNAKNFRQRRRQLSRRFPGQLLVIPTGHQKVRANDIYYAFRPASDFYYLTGCMEPDCVLVLLPKGREHQPLLFVEANAGRTDASFFTDRKRGELWEGYRPGVAESSVQYHIPCEPLSRLNEVLGAAASEHEGRIRILRGHSEVVERMLGVDSADQRSRDAELAEYLSEARLIKDSDEIRALRHAIAATKRGFEDVVARLQTAKSERELEGVFWTRARMEGNDVGYTSIVAAGAHACTLHWKKNDGRLRQGDLLLLDAGVESPMLYTADVTRTLPISGKFTREQFAVYEVVLAAQREALKLVRPGNDFMAPNRAAMIVLARGLESLGILPMSAEAALRDENQFYRRYSLHNISHMLGLDVHDCAQARAQHYKYGSLRSGMTLTIEPGLYFQPDDLTVPRRYRGIGVRIEDDVLVTPTGHRVLSAGLPTEPKEIERWMARIWKRTGPASRRGNLTSSRSN